MMFRACAMAVLVGCAAAVGQPQRGGDRRPVRGPERPAVQRQADQPEARRGPVRDDLSADAVRAMIRRELERLAQRERTLREGLEALEAGASPAEVASRLRGQVRGSVVPAPDAPGLELIPQPTREELETFVREQMPAFWERFRQARDRAPGIARAMEERIRPRLIDLYRMHKADPDLGRLHIEEFQTGLALAEAHRRLTEARRAGRDTEGPLRAVREVVGALFDIRERIRGLELERVERRAQEIRRFDEDRDARRARFIEERVRALLRQDRPAGPGQRDAPPDPGGRPGRGG